MFNIGNLPKVPRENNTIAKFLLFLLTFFSLSFPMGYSSFSKNSLMKSCSIFLFILCFSTVHALDYSKLQFGDIFFTDPHSGQAKAVKIATRSEFSHCGILFSENKKWYILEAVQPVQVVPLDDFLTIGENKNLKLKRYKKINSLLTVLNLQKFLSFKKLVLGLDYDPYFSWSDQTFYCSELVWKIYHRVFGIQLCKLQPLKNYYLDDPIVKKIMYERYGDEIPYDELMVSPGDIYNSSDLEPVVF